MALGRQRKEVQRAAKHQEEDEEEQMKMRGKKLSTRTCS